MEGENEFIGICSDDYKDNGDIYYSNYQNEQELWLASKGNLSLITMAIKGQDATLSRNNPKKLKAELQAKVKNHKDIVEVHFTKDYVIYITSSSVECSVQILNLESLMGIKVSVSLQHERICSRFLLRDMDIDISLRDIAEELQSNGIFVFSLRRFKIKRDGKLVPSTTVLVHKLGIDLPSYVALWYSTQKISLFTDRPRQCATCHKYSHPTSACKSNVVCIICSGAHGENECSALSAVCALCSGNHKANSQDCIFWKREEEFLKFKSRNNLPFMEARRRYYGEAKMGQSMSLTVGCGNAQNVTKEELHATIQQAIGPIQLSMNQMIENQNTFLVKIQETIAASLEPLIKTMVQEVVRKELTTTVQRELLRVQLEGTLGGRSNPKTGTKKRKKKSLAKAAFNGEIFSSSSNDIFSDSMHNNQNEDMIDNAVELLAFPSDEKGMEVAG